MPALHRKVITAVALATCLGAVLQMYSVERKATVDYVHNIGRRAQTDTSNQTDKAMKDKDSNVSSSVAGSKLGVGAATALRHMDAGGSRNSTDANTSTALTTKGSMQEEANVTLIHQRQEGASSIPSAVIETKNSDDQILLAKLNNLWESLLQKNSTTQLNLTESGEDARWGGFPIVAIEAPNFLPRLVPAKQSDVVIATHLSADRLDRLRDEDTYWQGPISASIYMTSPTQFPTFVQYLSSHPSLRQYVSFHILLEWKRTNYPNNAMRELAMQSIQDADFFLALDADFIPPRNGHQKIQALMDANPSIANMMREKKTLFVFAGFVVMEKNGTGIFPPSPADREEVLQMLENKQAKTCDDQKYKKGHGPTNYNRWKSLRDTDVSSYSISPKRGFEPYIMGYRPGIPHYWTGFRGWGLNKISFIHELVVARYKFRVLRDFFVIHLGDLSSPPKGADGTINLKVWNTKYKQHLYDSYNLAGNYRGFAFGP